MTVHQLTADEWQKVPESPNPEPSRAQMLFFYIGDENAIFEHVNRQFERGYQHTNLRDAGALLTHLYHSNRRLPDVIFIDLPYDETGLQEFCKQLQANMLLGALPLIYSAGRLSESQIHTIKKAGLIDDVIRIESGEINYSGKIGFLKQSKLFNSFSTLNSRRPAIRQNLSTGTSFVCKRSVDIVVAVSGLFVLSPLLLLIAACIRIESKGPVIYTSLRAGKRFKIFRFFKFRTMGVNADTQVEQLSAINQYRVTGEGPRFFKLNNDPRVTKIGKILRFCSIDELPQLINVLIGDMSVVGNRPLPLHEAVTLTTDHFSERFSAPAGITGLWQVRRKANSDMTAEERINFDIIYSRNNSILEDLKILLKTPGALIQRGNT